MRRGVGARLGAAVAVLVVVALGAADAGLSINSSAPPAPHADDLLSKAERVASKAESFVKANQRLLSAVGGSVLLLHGQVRTRQAKRDDRVPLRAPCACATSCSGDAPRACLQAWAHSPSLSAHSVIGRGDVRWLSLHESAHMRIYMYVSQAFSTSILFMQSFRSAGLPIVTRG